MRGIDKLIKYLPRASCFIGYAVGKFSNRYIIQMVREVVGSDMTTQQRVAILDLSDYFFWNLILMAILFALVGYYISMFFQMYLLQKKKGGEEIESV